MGYSVFSLKIYDSGFILLQAVLHQSKTLTRGLVGRGNPTCSFVYKYAKCIATIIAPGYTACSPDISVWFLPMIKFYRNLALGSCVLMVLTALMFYIAHQKSQLTLSFFPERDQELLWRSAIEPEQP